MSSTAELCNYPRMKTLVEEVQKKYQEDVRYFAADRLARARCRREAKTVGVAPETKSAHPSNIHTSRPIDNSGQPVSSKSPFASLKPKVSVKTDKDSRKVTGKRQYTPIGDKPSSFHGTVTRFASTSVQVPSYKGYVSLSQNILAPNNKNVLVLPCFSDDQNDSELTEEMKEQFNMVNDQRHVENDYVEMCWQLFPYAPYALEKARCNFADVVNYYAMSVEEFKRILDTNSQAYGLHAQQVRNMEKWKKQACSKYPAHHKLLARLPKSTPDALARTSALCHAWFNVFVALSFIAIQHFKSEEEFQEDTGFEHRTLACRVCHVHECPYHGAMMEEEDDEADRDASLNIRTHVTTGRRAHTDGDALEYKSARHWKKLAAKASSVYDRPSFVPCSHEGSCEQAQCSCFEHEVTCEKSCGCSKSCPRRFSGCSCSKQQKTCWNNPKCQCFSLSRECDPDLCFRCGAGELLDSVSRGRDPDDRKLCQNVKIQSGIKKLTILGTSSIKDAGFGLYTVEAISAGDYLGEYTGEIISQRNAAKRVLLQENWTAIHLQFDRQGPRRRRHH
ncbi:uncharacterized protein J3D65DRAFT_18795 [Phyllosticta citribraziliensis]|uniref:CXC domain-containing protein n=1 Tax=Phyllosticta citribraziliensis TaxID=989973 RepID=A0ABR1MCT8_9PEZI